MSFSLLRVPKKAALTALRGLAVGTSCTLLLITEDRRRRINQARSALRNADRIRSEKQYHATRSALHKQSDYDTAVRKLEDTLSIDTYGEHADSLQQRDIYKSSGHPSGDMPLAKDPTSAPQVSGSGNASAAGSHSRRCASVPHIWGGKLGSHHQQMSPAFFARPVPVKSHTARLADPGPSLGPSIGVDESVQRMREAVILGYAQDLEDAVNILQKTLQIRGLTENDVESLFQAAAPLCRKCQEVDIMDQAKRVLLYVIRKCPLARNDYLAFNPQPVIDYATATAKLAVDKLQGAKEAATTEDRFATQRMLGQATTLFLPKFKDEARISPALSDWEPKAEKLMSLAFDVDMVERAADIFWRIQYYNGDAVGLVTRRFMERLLEKQEYNHVVNTFHLTRRKLSQASKTTWYAIGDLVTEAVDAATKQKPAKVLLCLVEQCQTGYRVLTRWATRLLYCHWRRKRNFEDAMALLLEFQEKDGLDKVHFPDGVFRVMIQIAVEAERWQAVDDLLAQLQKVKPSSCKDARILGLLALGKAKVGDWDGVWTDFENMEVKERIGDVFVPVLKEFVKLHTIDETEDFMKAYIDGLQVPVCRYVVNVMANKYGAVRDVDSFVKWLEYCSKAGFEVDAAFSNAILVNCRRRWDFSFEQLKIVYRKLQVLSKSFVDHLTEQTMISAAITSSRDRNSKAAQRHIMSLGIKSHTRTSISKTTNPEDIRLEMRQAGAMRRYRTVLAIYKRSLHWSINLDDGHLRLAVNATLRFDPSNPQVALHMIIEARARGVDVGTATMLVFLWQLKETFNRDQSDKVDMFRQLQRLIVQFETNGLSLTATTLMRAAHLCMGARHFSAAISLALSALERKGISYPYDGPSFRLLLMAYTRMGDAQGIKWVVAGGFHTDYTHKFTVLKALKDAKGVLAKTIQTYDIREAIRVINFAIDRVLILREKVAEDRKQLERETIEIMKQAALETEQRARDGGQGPGDGSDGGEDEEVARRRHRIVREFEEHQRREKEAEAMKEAARKADMRERAIAAEEVKQQTAEEAEEMAKLMMEGRYEIAPDF